MYTYILCKQLEYRFKKDIDSICKIMIKLCLGQLLFRISNLEVDAFISSKILTL